MPVLTPARFEGDAAGYAGIADLVHWRLDQPFAASGRFFGYECPDLFHLKDRWNFSFSTYDRNPGWATRYMAADPRGAMGITARRFSRWRLALRRKKRQRRPTAFSLWHTALPQRQ